METNTTPRIERLTREALGGPYVPPKSKPPTLPEADEDVARWQRIRRVVSAVILTMVVFGLWTLGLVTVIAPIA